MRSSVFEYSAGAVCRFAARCCFSVICLAVLGGCGDSSLPDGTVPGRWYTQAQVEAGEPLYQTYCASCHAADGSATPDWRKTDENGNYPPPPLNGTAHTWHHPMEVLTETIAEGGGQYGGLMPGFGQVIDADERLAIVAYIQSWWPDDIYARWDDINSR